MYFYSPIFPFWEHEGICPLLSEDDFDFEDPGPVLVMDFVDDADFERRFRAFFGEDGEFSFVSLYFVFPFPPPRIFRCQVSTPDVFC